MLTSGRATAAEFGSGNHSHHNHSHNGTLPFGIIVSVYVKFDTVPAASTVVESDSQLPSSPIKLSTLATARQPRIDEAQIARVFSVYGRVIGASIKSSSIDSASGAQHGYAFVHFESSEAGRQSARSAVQQTGASGLEAGGVRYSAELSKNFQRGLCFGGGRSGPGGQGQPQQWDPQWVGDFEDDSEGNYVGGGYGGPWHGPGYGHGHGQGFGYGGGYAGYGGCPPAYPYPCGYGQPGQSDYDSSSASYTARPHGHPQGRGQPGHGAGYGASGYPPPYYYPPPGGYNYSYNSPLAPAAQHGMRHPCTENGAPQCEPTAGPPLGSGAAGGDSEGPWVNSPAHSSGHVCWSGPDGTHYSPSGPAPVFFSSYPSPSGSHSQQFFPGSDGASQTYSAPDSHGDSSAGYAVQPPAYQLSPDRIPATGTGNSNRVAKIQTGIPCGIRTTRRGEQDSEPKQAAQTFSPGAHNGNGSSNGNGTPYYDPVTPFPSPAIAPGPDTSATRPTV